MPSILLILICLQTLHGSFAGQANKQKPPPPPPSLFKPPPSPPPTSGGGEIGTKTCGGTHVCSVKDALSKCGTKGSPKIVSCCCHSDVCPEVCCEEPLTFGVSATNNDLELAKACGEGSPFWQELENRIKACNARGNSGNLLEPDYVAKCATGTYTAPQCPTAGATEGQTATRLCSWCNTAAPMTYYTPNQCSSSLASCCPSSDTSSCCSETNNPQCCGFNPLCVYPENSSCTPTGSCIGCSGFEASKNPNNAYTPQDMPGAWCYNRLSSQTCSHTTVTTATCSCPS